MVSIINFTATVEGEQESTHKIDIEQKLTDLRPGGLNPNMYRIAHSYLEFLGIMGADLYTVFDAFLKMFVLKLDIFESELDVEDAEDVVELKASLQALAIDMLGISSKGSVKKNVPMPDDVEKFQEQIANNKDFATKVMAIFLDDMQT